MRQDKTRRVPAFANQPEMLKGRLNVSGGCFVSQNVQINIQWKLFKYTNM